MLTDSRLGIDASYYLNLLTENPPSLEPLLAAAGRAGLQLCVRQPGAGAGRPLAEAAGNTAAVAADHPARLAAGVCGGYPGRASEPKGRPS